MEHIVHTATRPLHRVIITYISNIEAGSPVSQPMAKIILLGLITAQDPDLVHSLLEQASHNGLSEGTGATGDQHAAVLNQLSGHVWFPLIGNGPGVGSGPQYGFEAVHRFRS